VVQILNEYFADIERRWCLIITGCWTSSWATDDGAVRIISDDDAGSNAVAAAICHRGMSMLSEDHRRIGSVGDRGGIGINTGTVTVGYIGSRGGRTTAIGDAVNLAARLEARQNWPDHHQSLDARCAGWTVSGQAMRSDNGQGSTNPSRF
jgi:hypothetical protein